MADRRNSITWNNHHNDVIMGAMESPITSLTIVYSAVYSGADQRKHQSSASLAFVRGIQRWPVNSPHKGPVTRKTFALDDVIMMMDQASMSWHTEAETKWRHFADEILKCIFFNDNCVFLFRPSLKNCSLEIMAWRRIGDTKPWSGQLNRFHSVNLSQQRASYQSSVAGVSEIHWLAINVKPWYFLCYLVKQSICWINSRVIGEWDPVTSCDVTVMCCSVSSVHFLLRYILTNMWQGQSVRLLRYRSARKPVPGSPW